MKRDQRTQSLLENKRKRKAFSFLGDSRDVTYATTGLADSVRGGKPG